MDECAIKCQRLVDYMALAHGEKWYDIAERDRQERAELRRLIDGVPPQKPPRKSLRIFLCSECGAEVETNHHRQVTCASPECKRRHKLKRDAKVWRQRQQERKG